MPPTPAITERLNRELPMPQAEVKLSVMTRVHKEFWQKHPALVWSNPEADDTVHIRAALVRPRFNRLLDIALEFGLERLRQEWAELLKEDSIKTRQGRNVVERILTNIHRGF